ncbi:MAG: ankyrin repeat domain-containing protein [Novosphingobium sp.]|nr:ankyrin repeat domain-containing protein [Novosphingobium sp.]
MKKKYINLILISNLILNNNLFGMKTSIEINTEIKSKDQNQNRKFNLLNLPNEILLIIIQYVIESHIFNWNCITDWQIIKNEIITDLENIFLTCIQLSEFRYHKKYIVNNIKFFSKPKKDIFLKNRKIKTFKLFELLNRYNDDERYWYDVINLIDNGADINTKDTYQYTALMSAVFHGHKIISQLLIERNADVNIKDDNNETALMIASINGNKEIAELLIISGANINAKNDSNGYTALMMAAINNHKQIVELLINNGADINIEDNNNDTALFLAANQGNINIVELLTSTDGNYIKLKKEYIALILIIEKSFEGVVKSVQNCNVQ